MGWGSFFAGLAADAAKECSLLNRLAKSLGISLNWASTLKN